jgi:selenocysteine lyase/cysteine desulfurase
VSAAAFDPAALRAAYSRFLAGDRVLFTGHSHQAWPDALRDALARAFDDAAALVDDKWGEAVFPRVASVGRRILARMGYAEGDPIAFGRSTQELVLRLLTCLPWTSATRLVTTDGEFHSLYRQLARLAEAGVEVVWVKSRPREGLADRVLDALVPGTSMLALSAVLFEDAYVVPRLGEIAARAAAIGAIPLVDAYHAFNVVPLDWGPAADALFVLGGGYKYAAFGEGLCWMRFPRGAALRPIDTGWFADFAGLAQARGEGAPAAPVGYGPGGDRFAGSTFDPIAFYRAEAALDHWDRFGLGPAELRAISLRQTRRILDGLEARGHAAAIASSLDDARRGGFVALRAEGAGAIVDRLRARRVLVDARGSLLRLGPAPYLLDEEIDRGVALVASELADPG